MELNGTHESGDETPNYEIIEDEEEPKDEDELNQVQINNLIALVQDNQRQSVPPNDDEPQGLLATMCHPMMALKVVLVHASQLL